MAIKFNKTKITLSALKESFIKSTKQSLFHIVATISKASLGFTFIFEGDVFRSVCYCCRTQLGQSLVKGENF